MAAALLASSTSTRHWAWNAVVLDPRQLSRSVIGGGELRWRRGCILQNSEPGYDAGLKEARPRRPVPYHACMRTRDLQVYLIA